MNRYYITEEDYNIAKLNGISRKNVRNRVYELNWDVKKAITTPIGKRGRFSELYDDNIRNIIKENGIKPETIRNRILTMGMTPNEASTTPILNKTEALRLGRIKNTKYNQIYLNKAIKNGISRWTFIRRIKKGMTNEEASTKALIPLKDRGGKNEYWRMDNKLLFKKNI